MLKSVFYSVCLLLCAFSSLNAQQNLVPNGGFEEYYSCPISNDLNNGQLELAKGWWKPTAGTSDYFNRCNNGIVGVPSNFWGYQEAFEGNGYVGLVPCVWNINSDSTFDYEYIQTKLKKPLTPCKKYHFEMIVSLANKSLYSYSKLGMILTKDSFSIGNNSAFANPILLACKVCNNSYLSDTSKWMTIQGDFVAEGNEEYLSIGYFFKSVLNDTLFFPGLSSSFNQGYGYYYIDNVSLIETGLDENCDYSVPNFFTPNGDGTNDIWEFHSIEQGELSIFNRWGNEVFHDNKALSFQWSGENLADGVYFYKFYLENTIKTGFIHLIR